MTKTNSTNTNNSSPDANQPIAHSSSNSPFKYQKYHQQAKELAQQLLIIDSHIDIPYRLEHQPEDISQQTKQGDFDYIRAKQGGLNIAFMSIYVPASYQKYAKAKSFADKQINLLDDIHHHHADKFYRPINSNDALKEAQQQKLVLPMGLENGAAIEDSLDNIEYFHQRGIRYITLCHSKTNQLCDSATDTDQSWSGLSPLGKKSISIMNQLGMMIDISHVSDKTFYQVIDLSQKPIIASHSACRHFIPGFERNMSDDMLKVLANQGGIINLNFGSMFLSKATNQWYGDIFQLGNRNLATQYQADNPMPYATLDDALDHIDHITNLIGVDHIGIGSDYDGVGDALPENLKDVSAYPNLIAGLLARNYTPADIKKIVGGNFLRVWQAIEAE